MTTFLLVISLHGSTGRVEVPAGIMATEELCAMAGDGIVVRMKQQVPDVAATWTCYPQIEGLPV